jgi:superfamily II DNA helicase RecQ
VLCCNLIIRGKEFRQAFKRIGGLCALKKVPFMTLTASAPVSVQEDIIQSLSLTNIAYVKCSLD